MSLHTVLTRRSAKLLGQTEVILGARLEGKSRTEVQEKVRIQIADAMVMKKQRPYEKQECEITLRTRQAENKLQVLKRHENDKGEI